MASANVVFGKVGSGLPLIDYNFTSETVASAAQSAASPAGSSVIRVTPITANMWVAFGANPDASVATLRVLVPVGSFFEVNAPAGTKAAVLDA